jgi:peptide/nickel transport system permease protein
VVSYILRRLGYMLFVLWGVSFAAFFISQVVPGDPAASALGSNAREEQITAYRERLGLDKPPYVQYAVYMQRLFQGDLGKSIRTRRPILEDLKDFFPATLELALVATLFAVAFGLPTGILAALNKDKWLDVAVRTVALVAGATPIYWLAILLLTFFHSRLGWLPGPGRYDAFLIPPPVVSGFMSIDTLLAGDFGAFVDAMRHLVLPALVLGAFSTALLTRMVRSTMLEVLSQDYVRTASAKGLNRRMVILKHALRNAALPILTVLGSLIGSLLTGAVLTETIFSWPGIGGYATASAINLDFPAVMGVTLVAGLTYAALNLLVDILYAVFDPRISYS